MTGRKSVYFRKGKDKDLIKYINNLLEHQDFSEIARSLMRDGIKYRKKTHNNPTYIPTSNTCHKEDDFKVKQSSESTSKPSINDIELVKKETPKEDLCNRLDNF